jgi:microcystin-dependent protein
MATVFIGQILLAGFGFTPKGYAQCAGQLLPINQYQALFAIIGTQFGGDGIRTFGLPNLQGRVPVGSLAGTSLGEMGGSETVTLTSQNIPSHSHTAKGSTTPGDKLNPTGNVYGGSGTEQIYTTNTSSVVTLDPATLGKAGGSGPHENMQPSLVINFNIALNGIFPSRD